MILPFSATSHAWHAGPIRDTKVCDAINFELAINHRNVVLPGGQVNAAVQIGPVEKYVDAAVRAMGRAVFKNELSDPQGLIAEFLERIPQTTVKTLLTRIPIRKDSETLSKAS